MIIINKSGFLKYKHFKFKCALGKAGIKKKKLEGDQITPKGTYKIINIYFRNDRVKKIYCKFKLIKITKKMGWCDDPTSKKYNQLINIPSKYNYEKLFRKDNIYDLIIVLNYNTGPVSKFKGSAIFIHVAKKNYLSTEGCIALKKQDLIQLLKIIPRKVKIVIN